MKTIVNENQRGLLFKNGRFVKALMPGKHFLLGNAEVELCPINEALMSEKASIDLLLSDGTLAAETTTVEVDDCSMALHFVDGRFNQVLRSGKYAFFNAFGKHTFTVVDITTPEVTEEVPKYIFAKIHPRYFHKFEVRDFEVGRLYINNHFVRMVEPGTYYFWKTDDDVWVENIDRRIQQLDVTGQELLTQDKVSVRVNFVCDYRITDCERVGTEAENYLEQIHTLAQLAMREYLGKHPMDKILESKEEMAACILGRLKEREAEFFVEFRSAGVKDIILPGEIRDIMNTVLAAEKRAQANVITRREEVASTRSLLNTAKLMDENKTLYKLKEMEYVERICENVGNINISGGDLAGQLLEVLRGK